MRFASWLESVLAELRLGIRQLIRTPVITLAVVLSLAIGIGANTAVFTLLDAAILKPLPVPEPDRLRVIEWTNADGFPGFVKLISGDSSPTPDGGMRASSVSVPIYRALARDGSGLDALVGISGGNQVSAAVGSAPAEPVELAYVSGNFFTALRIPTVPGRPFLDRDDRTGETPAVVVSHRFWINRLGGTADALGRQFRINDVDVRIVGVAPAGFFGLSVGDWTDLYAPLASRPVLDRLQGATSEDAAEWWVRQVAVLADDVRESTALAQLNAAFRNQVVALAGPATDTSLPELVASPGLRGVTPPPDEIRKALWLLMLLVGLLLLVVCANVANLLLARAEGRLRESAVRLTLGATPLRLFRQQFVESLLLALAGGGVGLALGSVLSTAIHNLFQSGRDASSLLALGIDARVASYAIALSLAAAILFGASPAFRAARAGLGSSLRAHARSISSATLRGPKLLVSAQIALCLGALVAAGLLGRSLQELTAIDFGFDPENLVYATVNPGLSDFPAGQVDGYLDSVQHSLEAMPGVESVSRLTTRPLEGGGNFYPVNIPGAPRGPGFDPRFVAAVNGVGPEVFETLRIPLRAGRTVDASGNGVVVDELFAEKFFGGQDALGRRFGLGAPGNDNQYEIVGIARNTISLQLRRPPLPTVYVPHEVTPSASAISFAIRTSRNPKPLLAAIRTTVSSVNASVPLTELRTQTELLDRMLRSERLLAFLSGGFSVIATALAALGLAGLLAYAVVRRTSEIGLRMALGAAPGRMVGMVMKDSLKLIAAGLLVGIPCALGIAKLLESSLYDLAPADPATLAGSLLILIAISLAAAFVPARRAARTAPSAALRED